LNWPSNSVLKAWTFVVPKGKANPRQPSLNENSLEKFKELAGARRDNWFDYPGKKQNPYEFEVYGTHGTAFMKNGCWELRTFSPRTMKKKT
jgi:hypothetical protein